MSLDSKFRDAKPLLTTGLEPQEVAEMVRPWVQHFTSLACTRFAGIPSPYRANLMIDTILLQFFRSINEDDNDLFLATVTLNMRREGGVPRLGAFSWREWIEGREKHRKYKAEASDAQEMFFFGARVKLRRNCRWCDASPIFFIHCGSSSCLSHLIDFSIHCFCCAMVSSASST